MRGQLHTIFLKFADYIQLAKFRLSMLVVFSAYMSYLWANDRHVEGATAWLLSVGGFLITASSNVLNQVLEKDSDKLMKRTAGRPLAAGRMKRSEAIILACIMGVVGIVLLGKINFLSAILGVSALILYAGVYTPLKKVSTLTIIPGAIAGSLPVVIGWVASRGSIGIEACILFIVQFIWQFPHTWSIAWLLNDDYNKAGLKLLPMQNRNNLSALLIMASTFLIIPSTLLLHMYALAGTGVMWLLLLAGAVIIFFAFRFYRYRTRKSAVGLMLSCLVYLPLVLIILVAEKYI